MPKPVPFGPIHPLPMHILVRVVAAVVSAAASLANAASPKMAAHEGDFHETVSQDVVVSGAVIVGVSDASPIDGKALSGLAIVNGTDPSPEVCLSVLTRDGVYMASNRYVLPREAEPGDVVMLPYKKSRHLAFLTRYADLEIAVRVTSGTCDAPAGNTYVVHRSDSSGQHQLRLYINSFNATDVYASFSGHEAVNCVPVEGRRTSFDYVCSIDLPPAIEGAAEVTVEREIYGRELPRASVSILHGSMP